LLLAACLAVVAISEISSRNGARAEIDVLERATLDRLQAPGAKVPAFLVWEVRASASTARSALGSLILRGGNLVYKDQVSTILAEHERRAQAISDRAEVVSNMPLEVSSEKSTAPETRGSSDSSVTKPPYEEAFTLNFLAWGTSSDNTSATIDEPSIRRAPVYYVTPSEKFGIIRNDYLLAIVVVCCTLIGTIVTGLRAGEARFDPVNVALGCASGFIAFIALRGGRNVFLMELSGEAPHFNPYSMAFSGLVVGLFTAKAYSLLAMLVNDLSTRLEVAFTKSAAAAAQANNAGQGAGQDAVSKSNGS
jgi:hypothetical protein